MYRTILCTAAGAAIFAMPAKADETLKFRVVQYVALNQNQQIGDVPNHVQGFIRYPGMASFSDGSTAKTIVFNAYDGVAGPGGGGTVNGYENIVFSDGSELWWKYIGTYKIDSKGVLSGGGTFTVTSGKGRYAGAKGDGTYEGVQTSGAAGAAAGSEVLGALDFVVNIKK
jgi:hypothetical protein